MAWALFGSVVVIGLSALYSLHMHQRFRAGERTHKDTTKLAEHLEAKLAQMTELKTRMEQLLLKNGLGR